VDITSKDIDLLFGIIWIVSSSSFSEARWLNTVWDPQTKKKSMSLLLLVIRCIYILVFINLVTLNLKQS